MLISYKNVKVNKKKNIFKKINIKTIFKKYPALYD
jgi:hypothetical protein